MKTTGVVLAAILSILLCELVNAVWLGISGSFMDVTGNFWLLSVVPVVFLVVLLQTFALWRVYRSAPLRFGLLYGCLFTILHGLALYAVGNSVADVAFYAATEAVLTTLVIGGCHLLFWRRSS